MHSMTGFGRAEHTTDAYLAKVEISSVNRKNGEVLVQLPKSLQSIEADVRKVVLAGIQRGRVNVSITVQAVGSAGDEAVVDEQRLNAFVAGVKKIEALTGEKQTIDLSNIIRAGGILTLGEQELDPELALLSILPAVCQALKAMVEMRSTEGEHMKQDIATRIDNLEAELNVISERAPVVVQYYRESLIKRLKESGLDINLDDERVLKEVGLFAEKCDISEEITRLISHFAKFREFLESKEPVGRSLDFLCQEMNREYNTIGSKANDATLAQHVVSCKTELEKAREQVQNIE